MSAEDILQRLIEERDFPLVHATPQAQMPGELSEDARVFRSTADICVSTRAASQQAIPALPGGNWDALDALDPHLAKFYAWQENQENTVPTQATRLPFAS